MLGSQIQEIIKTLGSSVNSLDSQLQPYIKPLWAQTIYPALIGVKVENYSNELEYIEALANALQGLSTEHCTLPAEADLSDDRNFALMRLSGYLGGAAEALKELKAKKEKVINEDTRVNREEQQPLTIYVEALYEAIRIVPMTGFDKHSPMKAALLSMLKATIDEAQTYRALFGTMLYLVRFCFPTIDAETDLGMVSRWQLFVGGVISIALNNNKQTQEFSFDEILTFLLKELNGIDTSEDIQEASAQRQFRQKLIACIEAFAVEFRSLKTCLQQALLVAECVIHLRSINFFSQGESESDQQARKLLYKALCLVEDSNAPQFVFIEQYKTGKSVARASSIFHSADEGATQSEEDVDGYTRETSEKIQGIVRHLAGNIDGVTGLFANFVSVFQRWHNEIRLKSQAEDSLATALDELIRQLDLAKPSVESEAIDRQLLSVKDYIGKAKAAIYDVKSVSVLIEDNVGDFSQYVSSTPEVIEITSQLTLNINGIENLSNSFSAVFRRWKLAFISKAQTRESLSTALDALQEELGVKTVEGQSEEIDTPLAEMTTHISTAKAALAALAVPNVTEIDATSASLPRPRPPARPRGMFRGGCPIQ